MITDTLFEAVEEAMRAITTLLPVRFAFDVQVRRTEIFQYPMPAIREALLNAIVHRDYRSPSDVIVKIFDNEIRISNPGALVEGLTVADLARDNYPSRQRNVQIAEAFYLTGDIEKYGTGYLRIRAALIEYPDVHFQFQEEACGFVVSFAPPYHAIAIKLSVDFRTLPA
jgi:ATP-dependent DNA helicase RecG